MIAPVNKSVHISNMVHQFLYEINVNTMAGQRS